MFQNNGKASGARNSAVTIIGPTASVKGNIAFSGYLRVQGSVVGDVTCGSTAAGTTVVHGAGSVSGAIKTPNIVVGGRVEGPIEAAESIEIHDGATVVGDAHYKLLAIQEGGVIEGRLIPIAQPGDGQPHQERRVAAPEAPAIRDLDGPHAHDRRASDHFWSPTKLVVVVLLAVAAGGYAWYRSHKPATAPAFVPTPAVEPQRPAEPPTPPVKAEEPPPAPKPEPVPPAPPVAPEPKPLAPAAVVPEPARTDPRAELPKADPNKVITVQGMDLDKPSDVFFVATKEPVVLYKKQRSDTGDGTRIDLAAGAKRRFYVSESEVVRVAHGRNLEMYFQGRKLSNSTIQSGSWMNFVPLTDGKPAAAQ